MKDLLGNAIKDLIVETKNPEYLDTTVQQLGAACVVGGGMPGGYVQKEGGYVVRCFGCADWIKFAIEKQGYGRVLKELDTLV